VSRSLLSIFEARSVAVIGASRDPAKFGNWVVRALVDSGYHGAIYPINPSASEVWGIPAYPEVKQSPGPVDLACVALPAQAVLDAVSDCLAAGVPHVIIFASGFGEAGQEGGALEARLVEAVTGKATRLIGPNSLGLVRPQSNLVACFGREIVQRRHPPGPVAFLTQSGAFGQALLCWAEDNGIGFSAFISSGNEADVDAADFLEALAEDEATQVICLYLEGVRRGRAFMAAASRAAASKPVLALKVGRTSAGRTAAASHTGALVGDDLVYEAVFRQTGVIRVRDAEEMFDLARALARQPLPRGPRVAIVTSSGGVGVAAADACEELGLEVGALSGATQATLRARLPGFAAVRNPVDLTSQVHGSAGWFRDCLRTLVVSNEVDGIIVGITAFRSPDIARNILDGTAGFSGPVLASWTIGQAARQAMDVLEAGGVPVYVTPERAVRALAGMYRYVLARQRAARAARLARPLCRADVPRDSR
jgi:acetyl coenzyme A synthetase (ADP forming)-like protein